MTAAPDGYVSRPDIARLAQVKRPAVSNWERRHKGFPQPERIGGEDYFPVDSIASWLDHRPIAVNRLLPDEQLGTTFGQRFRRNLAAPKPGGTVDAPPALPAAASLVTPEEDLWRDLERLRGVHDVGSYRNLVLGLIYARERDGAGWTDASGDRGRESAWATDALRKLAWEMDGMLPDLKRGHRMLAEVAGIVDRAVRTMGAAEAFRVFMDRFALWEGKRGGEFHTPRSVARVLVDVTAAEAPAQVYDPSCGSGELLLAAVERAQETDPEQQLTVRGDTLQRDSLPLARMNMELHGVDARLGIQTLEALCDPRPPHERFSHIITNPPFNVRNWCEDDPAYRRPWRYGPPPRGNANFAWLQYVLERLSPGGRAAVLMVPGTAFSENPRERAIRKALVNDGMVEALIALPPRLFPTTGIGATVWVLGREERPRQEVLFVDATAMGRLSRRNQRELSNEDHEAIAGVLADWRAERAPRREVPPSSAETIEELGRQNYNLNPSRYVRPKLPSRSEHGGQDVETLLRELDQLHVAAAKADAEADQALKRLTW
ncbi:N-6 DNA methylase [Nonomuraea sp. NPDC051191]|uniref:N-6 DNA methylase n=1 Tax=Nonomuraea sp. NPDC051191 TaxID=3364372 RepID=UPI003794BD50